MQLGSAMLSGTETFTGMFWLQEPPIGVSRVMESNNSLSLSSGQFNVLKHINWIIISNWFTLYQSKPQRYVMGRRNLIVLVCLHNLGLPQQRLSVRAYETEFIVCMYIPCNLLDGFKCHQALWDGVCGGKVRDREKKVAVAIILYTEYSSIAFVSSI